MRTTMGTTVGTTVDLDGALKLLPSVGPDFARRADALRATAAAAAEEDVPDRALQAALADRRVDLARNTYLYLRWRLETDGPSGETPTGSAVAAARAAARAAGGVVRARARAEVRARAAAESAAAGTRIIRDGEGRRWHVAEAGPAAGPAAPAGVARPRGLVFTSAGRRWHVPACPGAWRAYSDAALSALLPTV